MSFLLILLFFVTIFLLMLNVNFSFTKISILWTSKLKLNEEKQVLLPAFFATLSWFILMILWSFVIHILTGLKTYEYIINILVGNNLNNSLNFFGVFLITIGFIVCGIIIQSICYMSLNKTISYNRYPNDFYNDNMQVHEFENLNINSALFASLFSFLLIFFFILIFIVIGLIVGTIII